MLETKIFKEDQLTDLVVCVGNKLFMFNLNALVKSDKFTIKHQKQRCRYKVYVINVKLPEVQ